MTGLIGDRGRRSPPPDAEEFSKICGKFSKENSKKTALFWSIFQKNFKTQAKFSRLWKKNTIVLGKFETILTVFDENSKLQNFQKLSNLRRHLDEPLKFLDCLSPEFIMIELLFRR